MVDPLLPPVARVPLGRGQAPHVELYAVTLGGAGEYTDARLAGLSHYERVRATGIGVASVRDGYVAAWYTTRSLLAGCLGVGPGKVVIARSCRTCGCSSHGKPYVEQPAADVHFSVSHSHARALVAIGPIPVGVDIEYLQPTAVLAASAHAVDRVALSEAERSFVDELPGTAPGGEGERARLLLQLWTRKEAALKATGHGLSWPLASVVVAWAGGQEQEIDVHGQPVRLVDVYLEGGVGSLAWVPDCVSAPSHSDASCSPGSWPPA